MTPYRLGIPPYRFHWSDLLWFPLRAMQIAVITAFMLIAQWFMSLFEKTDIPARYRQHHHDTHEWRPPQITVVDGVKVKDLRSPCPAINTLANHGYLPRHGTDIKPHQFIKALQDGYNISYPLAAFLTWGSFILLQQWRKVSLKDLARHGCVEHNASLGREDAVEGKEYAPTDVVDKYMKLLLEDSEDGAGLTAEDIAKARVRRENDCTGPLDAVHAEIARGEMAMVLNLFGVEVDNRKEIPISRLSEWWTYERLPSEWKRPAKPVGLLQTFFVVRTIATHMNALRSQ
jgi:hypothetical protein